ncbi:DUF4166 domain-containing protein [Maritalea myrionectae]|uniref:DUF4166 domain-containing protein n=1 Tax=Maritalea myrionectae TaxID=454601 RepID=UPI000485F61A|nr:DUF4166 domain-containing protein [Maritalea myrionectae]
MSVRKPFFKDIFGKNWDSLPTVFRVHYANCPWHDDIVRVSGIMSVWQSPLIRPLEFLFRWTKTLIPVSADQLVARVSFRTKSDRPYFWYDRTILLNDSTEMKFSSYVETVEGNQVIEWTGLGVGWHSSYSFENGRIHLQHLGYRLRIGRVDLPLPVSWLIGKPAAWEEAVSETSFRMEMVIRHPIFGRIYSYSGQFEIEEIELAE